MLRIRPYSSPLTREQQNVEHNNTGRIEVERSFSLSKRCFSPGLIRTKTGITTFGAIGLSILITNLFRSLDRAGHYIFVFLNILFLQDIPREEREIVCWAHACRNPSQTSAIVFSRQPKNADYVADTG